MDSESHILINYDCKEYIVPRDVSNPQMPTLVAASREDEEGPATSQMTSLLKGDWKIYENAYPHQGECYFDFEAIFQVGPL